MGAQVEAVPPPRGRGRRPPGPRGSCGAPPGSTRGSPARGRRGRGTRRAGRWRRPPPARPSPASPPVAHRAVPTFVRAWARTSSSPGLAGHRERPPAPVDALSARRQPSMLELGERAVGHGQLPAGTEPLQQPDGAARLPPPPPRGRPTIHSSRARHRSPTPSCLPVAEAAADRLRLVSAPRARPRRVCRLGGTPRRQRSRAAPPARAGGRSPATSKRGRAAAPPPRRGPPAAAAARGAASGAQRSTAVAVARPAGRGAQAGPAARRAVAASARRAPRRCRPAARGGAGSVLDAGAGDLVPEPQGVAVELQHPGGHARVERGLPAGREAPPAHEPQLGPPGHDGHQVEGLPRPRAPAARPVPAPRRAPWAGSARRPRRAPRSRRTGCRRSGRADPWPSRPPPPGERPPRRPGDSGARSTASGPPPAAGRPSADPQAEGPRRAGAA